MTLARYPEQPGLVASCFSEKFTETFTETLYPVERLILYVYVQIIKELFQLRAAFECKQRVCHLPYLPEILAACYRNRRDNQLSRSHFVLEVNMRHKLIRQYLRNNSLVAVPAGQLVA